MVIVRLQGGLGNQLFQIAAARDLALRLGAAVLADVSWFGPQGTRHAAERARAYLLPELQLAPAEAAPAQIRAVKRATWWDVLWRRPSRVVRNPCNLECPVFELANGDVYLDGFWQGESFFRHASPALAAHLLSLAPRPEDDEWTQALRAPGSIALHVRRDDYARADNTTQLALPLDYYARAIEIFRQTMDVRSLVVFSDDLVWCRAELPALGLPLTCVSRASPDESSVADFLCLAQARHLIIANSTFSWWAAWIATRRGASVVAPAQWFHPGHSEAWSRMLRVPAWHYLGVTESTP